MNSRAIKTLLALCVLLLIIFLIEWGIAASSGEQTDGVDSVPGQTADQEIELPELKLAKQSLEAFADMVERPLFIEGRRPVIIEENENGLEEQGEIDDLMLMGVYTVEGHQVALFSQTGAGKNYIKKTEGEEVSGWLLKEIQTDRVTLERAGNQQSMMLRKPRENKVIHPRPVAKRKK